MTTPDLTSDEIPGYLNCPFCKAAELKSQEYKGGESHHCPACMRAVPLFCVALRWHEELSAMARRTRAAEAELRSIRAELTEARHAFTMRTIADSKLCRDCSKLIDAGKDQLAKAALDRFGYEPSMQKHPEGYACPKCKIGVALEGVPGSWCSRRYETVAPCDWEAP